ncbi:MAG: hypothetical protein SVY53_13890, partial [Chloroflexota bacterium]|nr:hypothetical protein [Chloroflexota bacterium]
PSFSYPFSIPLSQSDLLALDTFYMILLHLLGVQLNCRPKDIVLPHLRLMEPVQSVKDNIRE